MEEFKRLLMERFDKITYFDSVEKEHDYNQLCTFMLICFVGMKYRQQ